MITCDYTEQMLKIKVMSVTLNNNIHCVHLKTVSLFYVVQLTPVLLNPVCPGDDVTLRCTITNVNLLFWKEPGFL